MDESGKGILLLDHAGRLQYGDDTGLHLFHEATRADGVAQQPAASRDSLPANWSSGRTAAAQHGRSF